MRGDSWGCSSVGRALDLHSRGLGFNSPQLHIFTVITHSNTIRKSELLLVDLLVLVFTHCDAALLLVKWLVLYCCCFTRWWDWRRGDVLILIFWCFWWVFLWFVVGFVEKELFFFIGLFRYLEPDSSFVGLSSFFFLHFVLGQSSKPFVSLIQLFLYLFQLCQSDGRGGFNNDFFFCQIGWFFS